MTDDPLNDRTAVLYPLIADEGNSRVFERWLSSNDDYRTADTDRPLREAEFDLCIVDDEAFTRSVDDIRAVKEAASPALFPVLLLLSEQRSDLIESDRGRVADNVFATSVDEIVAMPIRQAELEWRIQALLRLRDQTEALQSHAATLGQYREMIQLLDDPIMLQDRQGKFRLLNDAVADFAGMSVEELHGVGEHEFMDEENARRIEGWKRTVLALERPVKYEIEPTFERSDRSAVFSTKRYPYYGENGELTGTIAICRNVTTLKRRETELEQFERAVNEATDLIAAIDREERYIFANPQYRAYHGVDRDSVAGLTVGEVLGDDEYETLQRSIARSLTGEEVSLRTTRTHPERGERILDGRYYPLTDDGEPVGVVAVLRDVTENEERRRQLRVIDRVFRHNLRNDLTVIRGLANQIGDADGDRDTAAAEIAAQADDLLTTSEKSHHITRVLSQPPESVSVPIDAVVREAAEAGRAARPDAEVSVTTPDDVHVLASPEIDRAIAELVRNAVIHNDRETPSVALRVDPAGDRVTVHIVDDGPGLPEMERTILETGRGVEELYHGSGLGLWLVYWIVHRSGGTVHVSVAGDRGSRVSVELPRTEDPPAPPGVQKG